MSLDVDTELQVMIERLQDLRSTYSTTKSAGDPVYHAFSTAIAQIRRAMKAIAAT
jgi:hypothetical protein